MDLGCPRCGSPCSNVARFCGNCGLSLTFEDGRILGAGRVRHPDPLSPSEPAEPIVGAENLDCWWQAVGGGTPLLGTEPLEVWVFNGGYSLENVGLRIRGEDRSGRELFSTEREIQELPRGASTRLEVSSWELPDPVQTIHVELIKADFSAPDD